MNALFLAADIANDIYLVDIDCELVVWLAGQCDVTTIAEHLLKEYIIFMPAVKIR